MLPRGGSGRAEPLRLACPRRRRADLPSIYKEYKPPECTAYKAKLGLPSAQRPQRWCGLPRPFYQGGALAPARATAEGAEDGHALPKLAAQELLEAPTPRRYTPRTAPKPRQRYTIAPRARRCALGRAGLRDIPHAADCRSSASRWISVSALTDTPQRAPRLRAAWREARVGCSG